MNDDKAQLMDELTLAQQDLLAVIARAVQDLSLIHISEPTRPY